MFHQYFKMFKEMFTTIMLASTCAITN